MGDPVHRTIQGCGTGFTVNVVQGGVGQTNLIRYPILCNMALSLKNKNPKLEYRMRSCNKS